jgi:serine/threonine-protein kinase
MSSPPTTLGKYQIIREIARSNDIVYEAYDPLMNRRVALKELAVPSGSTPQQKEERLKRFLREAKAAGSLAHPNIVTIFEVGEDGGRHYLVMEYLDGHTLRNELDAKGFLPIDDAVKIAESVLRGLEYAHQNGVIHRDIKPENIQILSDGRVKLTDFGIARLTFEPNITMDGQVFGTPSYMSPEQVVGRDIDVRSDLFSVGVVLYEMLAGVKPFTGDSVVSITYAITNKEPDQPAQIPHCLWMVILKALDKSPSLRYANTAEMLQALSVGKNAGNVMQSAPPMQQPPLGQTQYPGQSPYLQAPPNAQYINQPYPGGSYDPMAPPPQYPYNPYQPPPQTQLPGGINTNQYVPGGPQYPPGQTYLPDPYGPDPYTGQQMYTPQLHQIPVYYPPPPRRAVLSPSQKATLSKTALTVFVIGTAFAGLVWFLVTTFGSGSPDTSPAKPPTAAPAPDSATTAIAIPRGDSMAEKSNGETLDSSIALLQKAIEEPNVDQASLEFGDATNAFEKLGADYKAAGEPALAERSFNWAAKAQLQWACTLESSDRLRARTLLYRARQDASPDSDVAQQIESEVEKLT